MPNSFACLVLRITLSFDCFFDFGVWNNNDKVVDQLREEGI